VINLKYVSVKGEVRRALGRGLSAERLDFLNSTKLSVTICQTSRLAMNCILTAHSKYVAGMMTMAFPQLCALLQSQRHRYACHSQPQHIELTH
jgi:hypothetical protein